MTLAVVLLTVLLLFGPAHFDRWKNHLPYHARWGSYRIVVDQKGQSRTDTVERVRIFDKRGHLLREVRAFAITRVEEMELTGKPPAELHISLWSGGAYASFTEVYFTREDGLRNILIFDGDDLGVRGIKDLNHDGIPEIITANPAMGDFSAYSFHRHWPLITILGWNGKRYRNVTHLYPQRSLQEARARGHDIIEVLAGPTADRREWDLQDKITAYYANMLSIGRGREARQWLKRRLPKIEWSWLRKHDRELRGIVATAAIRSAWTSQHKIIDQMDGLKRRPLTHETE